jgi:hypothetical protein
MSELRMNIWQSNNYHGEDHCSWNMRGQKGNPKGEITGKGLRVCIVSTIFFIGKYLYSLH